MVRFRYIAGAAALGATLLSGALFAPSVLQPGGIRMALAGLISQGADSLGLMDGLGTPAKAELPLPAIQAPATTIASIPAPAPTEFATIARPANYQLASNRLCTKPLYSGTSVKSEGQGYVCIVTLSCLSSSETATVRRLPPPMKS